MVCYEGKGGGEVNVMTVVKIAHFHCSDEVLWVESLKKVLILHGFLFELLSFKVVCIITVVFCSCSRNYNQLRPVWGQHWKSNKLVLNK